MKLVKIKSLPKAQKGSIINDNTGLGTFLYNQPLEMQLSGTNPIVGGPMDVMATDQTGKKVFIPAGTQTPLMMQGKVKEVPMMKRGGITMHTNKGIPYYNPHGKNIIDPSLPDAMGDTSERDVAQSLKAVEEDDANVEAEKDELVVKPDLSGLYKVKGKTHKQGGTPLSLEPGSFIFSNDPALAINKKQGEVFDFEEFKSRSPKENTPAKVLLREVNPKEYNSLIATLEDDDKDKIAKTTAMMMLQKYQEKIGRVAFIQESKKDEPIPEFAMGTAPIGGYDEDQLEEEEQMYAKKGGKMKYKWKAQIGGTDPFNIFMSNPFLPQPITAQQPSLSLQLPPDTIIGGKPKKPKRQTPTTYPQIYPGGQTEAGSITPTGYRNTYDYPYGDPKEQNVEELAKAWERVGVNIRGKKNAEAQGLMYDWAMQNNPELLREMWATYGNTAKGQKLGLNANDLSDSNLAKLRAAFTDDLFGVRQFGPARPVKAATNTPTTVKPDLTVPKVTAPAPVEQPYNTTPPENIPSLGYDIKGKLTDSQLAHLGFMGLNAMGIKKYYPKREQVDLPEVNLDTINEQPYINDINNQSFQAYQVANAGDPRLGRVNASNIYGRGLDAISKTRGNIQNQNTQIQNQENLTNLQQRTNQVMANAQFDDRYYDQVQTTRENFDKERRYANNAVFSQLNQYQSQADQLAWGLASVNKYGRRLVTNPKTGQKYYQPVPLFEATQRGIRYNADVADLDLATGADKVNSVQEIKSMLEQLGIDPTNYKNLSAMGTFMRAMNQMRQPLYGTNPTFPQGQ